MTARDFFKQVYGETNLGTPVIKFAEEYHKARISKIRVDKHLKRCYKSDKKIININYCQD